MWLLGFVGVNLVSPVSPPQLQRWTVVIRARPGFGAVIRDVHDATICVSAFRILASSTLAARIVFELCGAVSIMSRRFDSRAVTSSFPASNAVTAVIRRTVSVHQNTHYWVLAGCTCACDASA